MAIFVMRAQLTAFLLLLAPMRVNAGEPFGLDTARAPAGPLWISWQDLESDIAGERQVIARCRADAARCDSEAAPRFISIVDQAAQLEGRVRIANVNRAFNLAIRWVDDAQQYGVAEIWKAPLATLSSGAGDCTDFAIAKFVALGDAGIAPGDLRIVFGRIETKQIDHAVLAARDEGQWLILDNRAMGLVSDTEFADFTPMIEIDHTGVWQFVGPQRTVAARAPCARTAG